MKNLSHFRVVKSWGAALCGLTLASFACTADAQTVFGTNFNYPDYAPAESLSGQTDPVYGGQWNTNDPDNGGTYTYGGNRTGFIGQTDDVDNVSGFSTPDQTDYSATLGGNFAGGIVPGVPVVTVDHTINFGAATTAAFNLDFVVTSSAGSYPAKDAFGFAFGTGTGSSASSLFSLNFTPSTNGTATDNAGYSSNANGGGGAITQNFNLNSKYHLAVNVNLAQQTFTAVLTGTINGAATTLPITADAKGNLVAVAYTGNLSDFALVWKLANSTTTTNGTDGNGNTVLAYSSPGNNFLGVDNLAVSVPEPPTYALMGLGMLGLVAMVRNRRAQRA